MSIFFPINAEAPTAPAAGICSGFTSAQATMDVAFHLAGQAQGTTALAGELELQLHLAATIASSTTPEARLRLNLEPDVDLDGTIAGSTAIMADLALNSSAVGISAGQTTAQASLTVERAEELTLTFFVDVTSATLQAALNKNLRSYSVGLVVDGTPVPVLSARLQAPANRLGTELTVIMEPEAAQFVGLSSSIDFLLFVWNGSGWEATTLLSGARLGGRGARYVNQQGLPADSVELQLVDVMGDRWNRAPRRQTMLYDPQVIDAPGVDQLSALTIYNSQTGASIAPLNVAIIGLKLWDALHAAYVEGCGFDKVITNIDNFPIEQIVFSLSGGYDAGVRPLLEVFEPIFFVVNNDLWIITLDNPLPAGFNARDLPVSSIAGVDDNLPRREPVNALLVQLKDTATGEYVTEREEAPPAVPSGNFGEEGYTETTTERRVREYRNFAAPTVIVREEEAFLKTTVEDYQFNEISIDTRESHFDALNRPTGYHRTQHSLLPNEAGELELQLALEETQTIAYSVHPLDPTRDVQSLIQTDRSGLILTDNDSQYLGKPYKIKLRDAHKSGYVNPDADQVTHFGLMETIIETIRVNGGQVVRDRRVIDHVANISDPPTTQTLPGDASFDRRRSSGRTRTVLLTVAGTDTQGRRVETFDGTGLPPAIALKLAEKRLARLNDPPHEAAVQMAYLEPSLLRRGVDLNVYARSSSLGVYLVRGYSASFTLTGDGFVAEMSLDAKELKR